MPRIPARNWRACRSKIEDLSLIVPRSNWVCRNCDKQLTRLIDAHADADAMFTADGGSPMVWLLRHVRANGRRRTLVSLLHGTMANAMPQALGLKKAFPDRQVISLSGDGGLAMLLGDLLTIVQENIPIKVVVYNNGTLGFVELEMKVEGLLNAYTDLETPDFAK